MLFALALVSALAVPQADAPKPATNTKCPVMGGKVKASNPKVVVRGQEYLLCCKGCDKKLLANPDKYLEKDGMPKNAKK